MLAKWRDGDEEGFGFVSRLLMSGVGAGVPSHPILQGRRRTMEVHFGANHRLIRVGSEWGGMGETEDCFGANLPLVHFYNKNSGFLLKMHAVCVYPLRPRHSLREAGFHARLPNSAR